MTNGQTFWEFYQSLLGFRVFKESYYNGSVFKKEVSKSELYWGNISLKEIHTNPKYIIQSRKS